MRVCMYEGMHVCVPSPVKTDLFCVYLILLLSAYTLR